METNHPGLPAEWAEQQGVLSAARDIGKNILLLAAKSAHSGSGAGGATDCGAGARGGKTDRKSVYPVSGSGTDAAGRNGYGGDSGSASLTAAAMIDLSRVSKYQVLCGLRVHGPAARDRRAGVHSDTGVWERTEGGQQCH